MLLKAVKDRINAVYEPNECVAIVERTNQTTI